MLRESLGIEMRDIARSSRPVLLLFYHKLVVRDTRVSYDQLYDDSSIIRITLERNDRFQEELAVSLRPFLPDSGDVFDEGVKGIKRASR